MHAMTSNDLMYPDPHMPQPLSPSMQHNLSQEYLLDGYGDGGEGLANGQSEQDMEKFINTFLQVVYTIAQHHVFHWREGGGGLSRPLRTQRGEGEGGGDTVIANVCKSALASLSAVTILGILTQISAGF